MPMSELKKKTGERRNGFLVAKEEMEEEEEKSDIKKARFPNLGTSQQQKCVLTCAKAVSQYEDWARKNASLSWFIADTRGRMQVLKKGQLLAEHI